MDKEIEKEFERLHYQSSGIFAEILYLKDIVEELAKREGIDMSIPSDELENNLNYLKKLEEEEVTISEPIFFQSNSDTYKNKIRTNIVKIIERNIPTYITDLNARQKYREELIREWSKLIAQETGHHIRTIQEVFKGNKDINADAILIMEKVIPQINRDDILGKLKKSDIYEYEYVLEKLRKAINKNMALTPDIEKILNKFTSILNRSIEYKKRAFLEDILAFIERYPKE